MGTSVELPWLAEHVNIALDLLTGVAARALGAEEKKPEPIAV